MDDAEVKLLKRLSSDTSFSSESEPRFTSRRKVGRPISLVHLALEFSILLVLIAVLVLLIRGPAAPRMVKNDFKDRKAGIDLSGIVPAGMSDQEYNFRIIGWNQTLTTIDDRCQHQDDDQAMGTSCIPN